MNKDSENESWQIEQAGFSVKEPHWNMITVYGSITYDLLFTIGDHKFSLHWGGQNDNDRIYLYEGNGEATFHERAVSRVNQDYSRYYFVQIIANMIRFGVLDENDDEFIALGSYTIPQ